MKPKTLCALALSALGALAVNACLSTDATMTPGGEAGVDSLDARASDTGRDDGASGQIDGSAAGDASDGATSVEGGADASDDATADATAGDADAGAPIDASSGEAGVPSTAAAAVQLDLVGPGDGTLTPDGAIDGTISATLVGPITALALITTDAAGAPTGGQQWDTFVGTDVIPPEVGAGFTTGSQTWQLGVFQGTTALNAADGRLSLAAGTYVVTLAASSSGFFTTGQSFRVIARLGDGTLAAGPVFAWP